jgi:hypothetical protein
MKRARGLLDRIEVLRHPSDVDLLIFFARHQRTLMSAGKLGTLLGYETKQIADSLDVLLQAGLLTRIPSRADAAEMYVFAADGTNEGLVSSLVELARTLDGRLAIRRALKAGPAGGNEVEKVG